jgi:hypothetical protein
MGKYEPLSLFLSRVKEDHLSLNFKQVENILGFDLPYSAKNHRAWWANDSKHNVSSVDGWMAANWNVKTVDFHNETVLFVRMGASPELQQKEPPSPVLKSSHNNLSAQFESYTRKVMSDLFKTALTAKKGNLPKIFDLVSDDEQIVGDAKYYSLVRGKSLPPAKFSTIAEHVWLLEKTGAKTKFLIFGNDRRVPEEWLKRYGKLVGDVRFYFLAIDGKLEMLN